jgi:hypothetical protein
MAASRPRRTRSSVARRVRALSRRERELHRLILGACAAGAALTAASAWTPADAVVLAGCVGTGTSRTCTCPHTNFAASREHAQALLEADPQVAGEILSMPEAIIRGRDAFGGLLDHDTQEVSDVDAHRT